jgi:hypothetical protein
MFDNQKKIITIKSNGWEKIQEVLSKTNVRGVC